MIGKEIDEERKEVDMRPDDWRNLGEDEIVEFDVHCKMNKSWAREFVSILNLN